MEGDPIVFQDDDLEALPVLPVEAGDAGPSVGNKEPNNLINDPGQPGHSIKTFTSFGNYNENHNHLRVTQGWSAAFPRQLVLGDLTRSSMMT